MGFVLSMVIPSASAAGFHYLRVAAIAGTNSEAAPEAGVGVSTWSDSAEAWVTFGGKPGAPGVRSWRVQTGAFGPEMGLVPPAFEATSPPSTRPWLVTWAPTRLGGDPGRGVAVEVDQAAYAAINLPGSFGVDPRRALFGPVLGVAATATWWTAPTPYAVITRDVGAVAGLTLRDTIYAQAIGLARFGMFADEPPVLRGGAVAGVYLGRPLAPIGLEVRGDVEHGRVDASSARETRWSARASLYWRFAPEHRTRIEERVQARWRAINRNASDRAAPVSR